ncbi:hypothetical protein CSUI_003408 [Cystoisospora suis]|uniref:Uncharacterized protein n=1 Tax=Cystoisospora suis TaxID=483139 RepID=A0A2C6L2N0_9APIC|nr:hypothetical protein CSUI_003408 [Cystoisospora suis]
MLAEKPITTQRPDTSSIPRACPRRPTVPCRCHQAEWIYSPDAVPVRESAFACHKLRRYCPKDGRTGALFFPRRGRGGKLLARFLTRSRCASLSGPSVVSGIGKPAVRGRRFPSPVRGENSGQRRRRRQ